MTINLASLTPSTQAWARAPQTADQTVSVNGTTRLFSGLEAAAYLFGQSLSSIRFQDTLDGVQLSDGRFEFPPQSAQWVSLSEVADALRYKYGVDPLIEFAPGLGLRGYSVADVNRILDLLNRSFPGSFSFSPITSATVSSQTETTFETERAATPGSTANYNAAAVSTLLDTASTPDLSRATEAELRQMLTNRGDLYTDRLGGFHLDGLSTSAMDVAVVSRLLVHDNISTEYQVLMDEYANRNNMIDAARRILDGGANRLAESNVAVATMYGMEDPLSELSAGQFSTGDITPRPASTDTVNDTITFALDPGWTTGMAVRVSATGGGLTQGPRYWVDNLGSGRYSLHSSPNTATGKVNLTASITADMTPDYGTPKWAVVKSLGGSTVVAGATQYKTFNLFDDVAEWSTGTKIRILEATTGMNLATDYYLRDEGNGDYGIFDTLADAQSGGEVGRMLFTAGFTGDRILERDVVTLDGITDWQDGTKVLASQTAGGLSSGTEYYLRKLGTDRIGRTRYNVFATAEQAIATGTPRPDAGLVAITGDIGLQNFLTPSYKGVDFDALSAVLNTLISNKVRDGDLDQSKLQTLTAQLSNNTEAMTALIKAFADINSQLAQALR